MSRKLLSLAALAAVFTLVVGVTDAEARRCGRNRGCCQNSNYGYGNTGYGQWGYGNGGYQQSTACCQPASFVATTACCNPRPVCCGAQAPYAPGDAPANWSQPHPSVGHDPVPVQETQTSVPISKALTH
jgi:hypothetical protein